MGIGIGIGLPFQTVVPRRTNRRDEEDRDILYSPWSNPLFETVGVWFPDFEREMLAHFARCPQEMYQMPPRKFEELVAAIFKNQGFDVQLTPETRDGGFDIIAINRLDITENLPYLIECKRFSPQRKVGVGIVRQLLGVVVDQRASVGILATTSFFTQDAQEFTERNHRQLSTSDYNAIVDWLQQHKNW
jgi:restriction system protein